MPSCVAHEIEAVLLEDLDRLQPVDRLPQPADAPRARRRRREREQRDDDVLGTRHEPEPRRGDDGERSLAAAQQAAEVVAGVVLLEPVEPFDDDRRRRAPLARRRPGRRVGPYRSTCTPPAFVAIVPPTVALSRAPRSTPYSQPARARVGLHSRRASTPAPAVTCAARRRRPVRARRAAAGRATISPCSGTDPPTSPVLPPCGTTATRAALQMRSTAATSATAPGRTTAGVSTLEPSGPVDGVAAGDIGIGEHVLGTRRRLAARRATSARSVHGGRLRERARDLDVRFRADPAPARTIARSRRRRSSTRTSTAP